MLKNTMNLFKNVVNFLQGFAEKQLDRGDEQMIAIFQDLKPQLINNPSFILDPEMISTLQCASEAHGGIDSIQGLLSKWLDKAEYSLEEKALVVGVWINRPR